MTVPLKAGLRHYSIYLKMNRKAMSFEQLFDVNAFRIILPERADCYQALGIIHQKYPTIIGRFKDYISAKKMAISLSIPVC